MREVRAAMPARSPVKNSKLKQWKNRENGSPSQSQANRVSSMTYVTDSVEFLARPAFKDKVFLHQKYVVEGLSTGEIADLCFSSRSTISKHLRLHAIPIRDLAERLLLNKGQLALGERRLKGRIQQKASESEIIQTILKLRTEGYSYRQIASWLDAKGLETKNRRARWQSATVLKIVRRSTNTVTS